MNMHKKESSATTLSLVRLEMNRPRVTKSARAILRAKGLFETHRLHMGLYKRVADRLGVDASYVSKVASGTRTSENVRRVLLKELNGLRERVC